MDLQSFPLFSRKLCRKSRLLASGQSLITTTIQADKRVGSQLLAKLDQRSWNTRFHTETLYVHEGLGVELHAPPCVSTERNQLSENVSFRREKRRL
jgi:hypothetical protein